MQTQADARSPPERTTAAATMAMRIEKDERPVIGEHFNARDVGPAAAGGNAPAGAQCSPIKASAAVRAEEERPGTEGEFSDRG